MKIWKNTAEPMLRLAGIDIKLLVTERQSHAYEYMSKCALEDIDLVITVGGDGILFEVINGMYERDDVRNAVDPVPVFPIPGTAHDNMIPIYCSLEIIVFVCIADKGGLGMG